MQRYLGQAQPWKPADATDFIRQITKGDPTLVIRKHAKEQMSERGLITGDILHVLKRGFVYEAPEKSTRDRLYKYRMECSTPNSNSRTLRIIVIPCAKDSLLKVVTIMWLDEAKMIGRQ